MLQPIDNSVTPVVPAETQLPSPLSSPVPSPTRTPETTDGSSYHQWDVGIHIEQEVHHQYKQQQFMEMTSYSAADFPVMEENQCSSTEGSGDEEEGVQWRVVDGDRRGFEGAQVEAGHGAAEEEGVAGMTPEEAQRELNRLLERCEQLTQKKASLEEECRVLIPRNQCDELYAYLKKTSEADDADDEDLSKFVLGRIGYDKVEVVDKMHQMLALEASLEDAETLVEKAVALRNQ